MRLQSSRLILFLIFLFIPVVYGQTDESLSVFAPVPANERSRLAARLKSFTEYRRERQWNKLFEMFPKTHTQHPELNKEDFLADIRKHGKAHIVEFTPEYTTENPTIDGDYAIYGCAQIGKGWGKKMWQAVTYASLENGEWVFSDILFTFSSLHARDPAPCEKH